MRGLLVIIPFIYLITNGSCGNPKDIKNEWKSSLPITPTELHANQGDCFSFKDSLGRYFLGTIMSFHKSEDGIWYGMCFNSYYDSTITKGFSCNSLRFSGRKVMYNTPEQYTMGFDITWVRDSVIEGYKRGFVCNIDLVPVKNIEILAEGNAMNFKQFCYYFHKSRNDRELPPDKYWDLAKENLRAGEYFTLKQITDWYKNFTSK